MTDPQEAQSQVDQPTQVRDISDSMPDGLQLALNRAPTHGFYVAFIFPWGNFTRVIFRRHPDAGESAKLPSATHLSQRYRGDLPVEEPPLLEALSLIEAMALDHSADRRSAIADEANRALKLLGEAKP